MQAFVSSVSVSLSIRSRVPLSDSRRSYSFLHPGWRRSFTTKQPADNRVPHTNCVKASAAPPPLSNLLKSPSQTHDAAVALGASKAILPSWKIFLLGILAGAYVSLGALLVLCVGGSAAGLKEGNLGLYRLLLGAIGLPGGLLLVVLTGAELFTGNIVLLTCAFMARRARLSSVIRSSVWSFLGNIVGSMLVVWLGIASGCVGATGTATAITLANAKVAMPFMQAFWRGVVCNWLVCLAIYTQNSAGDLASKFVAIWLPICGFVAMGMEHSVANMFFVPYGMLMGASVTLKQFLLANLLPVTLGNVVAGVVLVGAAYSIAFNKNTIET